MTTKIVAAILGISLLGASSIASAQFGGLGSKISALTGTPSSNVTPKQVVTKYVTGAKSVNTADIKMLRAVGLKEEAERAELQAKNLTEGATKDGLKDAAAAQTESNKALQEKFASGQVQMDEASKKEFANGMAHLGIGLLTYIKVGKEAAGFNLSPTAVGPSIAPALYIVKTLPDSIKSLGATLKSSIDFAKSNNIPIPKEAADATAAI